jgi:hypothetical protein
MLNGQKSSLLLYLCLCVTGSTILTGCGSSNDEPTAPTTNDPAKLDPGAAHPPDLSTGKENAIGGPPAPNTPGNETVGG